MEKYTNHQHLSHYYCLFLDFAAYHGETQGCLETSQKHFQHRNKRMLCTELLCWGCPVRQEHWNVQNCIQLSPFLSWRLLLKDATWKSLWKGPKNAMRLRALSVRQNAPQVLSCFRHLENSCCVTRLFYVIDWRTRYSLKRTSASEFWGPGKAWAGCTQHGQSKVIWSMPSCCMNNLYEFGKEKNGLDKMVWVWHKIPKHFLHKDFLQMNSSDSQKTPLSTHISPDTGISTFITAVMLLYCRHELMPSSSGSRRKRLA